MKNTVFAGTVARARGFAPFYNPDGSSWKTILTKCLLAAITSMGLPNVLLLFGSIRAICRSGVAIGSKVAIRKNVPL